MLRLGLLFYAILAGGGLLWIGLRGDDLATILLSTRCPPGVALLIGGCAGGAVVLASDFWVERWAWTERLRGQVDELFGPVTLPRALLLACSSGISEEILFRGALQPVLGLWLSALLFGLLHCGPRLSGWAVFAFLAGLLLGGLFQLTGGVLAPACAHVLINGLQLVRLSAESRTGGDAPD